LLQSANKQAGDELGVDGNFRQAHNFAKPSARQRPGDAHQWISSAVS